MAINGRLGIGLNAGWERSLTLENAPASLPGHLLFFPFFEIERYAYTSFLATPLLAEWGGIFQRCSYTPLAEELRVNSVLLVVSVSMMWVVSCSFLLTVCSCRIGCVKSDRTAACVT
jgi:hypothetical protein